MPLAILGAFPAPGRLQTSDPLPKALPVACTIDEPLTSWFALINVTLTNLRPPCTCWDSFWVLFGGGLGDGGGGEGDGGGGDGGGSGGGDGGGGEGDGGGSDGGGIGTSAATSFFARFIGGGGAGEGDRGGGEGDGGGGNGDGGGCEGSYEGSCEGSYEPAASQPPSHDASISSSAVRHTPRVRPW
eukprot:scaffold37610_cov66-Phaeocystis_antarctica.AAC.3